MIKTLLGTKSNMSSVFNRFGRRIPVTYVVAEPNIVVSVKGNRATLGFGKKKKSKKSENAFIKAAGYSPRFIREVNIEPKTDRSLDDKNPEASQSPQTNPQENQQTPKINLGEKVTVDIFKPGDQVKVTGITKGRGFAGGVKRWGFAGGPKTHGQSDRHRAPGSIGAGTDPGRVFKGKKMAGHMGNAKLTVRGLEVVEVDGNKNTLLVKGSVPGAKNGLLIIKKTGQVKGYTPPQPPTEEKVITEGTEKVNEGTENKREGKNDS